MSDNFYQQYQSCQQGDIGVALVVTITDEAGNLIDLRTASIMTISLGYPDGTSRTFAAQFVTDGSDGQIMRVTRAQDLSQAGEYQIQGIVTIGPSTKSTAVSSFHARKNLGYNPPTPPAPEDLVLNAAWDQLVQYSLLHPTLQFFGYATDQSQLYWYTGDPSRGTNGFIAVGGG